MILLFSLATPAFAADIALPSWSYDGDETGQDDWGTLSEAYAACEVGTQQSPVQVAYPHASYLPALELHYHSAQMQLRHTEHGIEINVSGEQTLKDGGHIWRLKRIEFHTPSEHMIKDIYYPLEIHLIHENAAHQLLIVAMFANTGKPLAALQPIIDRLAQKPEQKISLTFNPSAFFPVKQGYYAYTGSLTYPPCTEGVAWRILKQPISISDPQFSAMAHILGRNARLIQPVYMRTIEESIP